MSISPRFFFKKIEGRETACPPFFCRVGPDRAHPPSSLLVQRFLALSRSYCDLQFCLKEREQQTTINCSVRGEVVSSEQLVFILFLKR